MNNQEYTDAEVVAKAVEIVNSLVPAGGELDQHVIGKALNTLSAAIVLFIRNSVKQEIYKPLTKYVIHLISVNMDTK